MSGSADTDGQISAMGDSAENRSIEVVRGIVWPSQKRCGATFRNPLGGKNPDDMAKKCRKDMSGSSESGGGDEIRYVLLVLYSLLCGFSLLQFVTLMAITWKKGKGLGYAVKSFYGLTFLTFSGS